LASPEGKEQKEAPRGPRYPWRKAKAPREGLEKGLNGLLMEKERKEEDRARPQVPQGPLALHAAPMEEGHAQEEEEGEGRLVEEEGQEKARKAQIEG
jgi:hypothetical protein